MKKLTGVPSLDYLIGPVRPGWIVELYGWEQGVRLVLHHAIAEASKRGPVTVVHVQEFGGLDPYLLRRLVRFRRGYEDNILVARAFRLQDVPGLIREAVSTGSHTIIVSNPYLYAPRSWTSYDKLTPITSALKEASLHDRYVLVFNQSTRMGKGKFPEGGQFHHHTVHVIVRLVARARGLYATLVKHVARPVPRSITVPMSELEVGFRWDGQRHLLEYL
ncbi:MAG: DNA recombination/repair protein RecA [Desulfurococcales archaeon]|nr:DNA recombination/repair protein RecA [Desulfurococcales archaeon]